MAALRSAAAGYDDGASWHAKHIATVIYILIHDGQGRQKSLLGQLGLKGSARLISSARLPPSTGPVTSAMASPLVLLRADWPAPGTPGFKAEWLPALGSGPFAAEYEWMPVSRWWDEVICHPASGFSLTRKNVVFLTRSQDGGAHVDSHRSNTQYDQLVRFGDPFIGLSESGVAFGKNPPGDLVPNPMRAIVRQLGWEMDESLKKLGL